MPASSAPYDSVSSLLLDTNNASSFTSISEYAVDPCTGVIHLPINGIPFQQRIISKLSHVQGRIKNVYKKPYTIFKIRLVIFL